MTKTVEGVVQIIDFICVPVVLCIAEMAGQIEAVLLPLAIVCAISFVALYTAFAVMLFGKRDEKEDLQTVVAEEVFLNAAKPATEKVSPLERKADFLRKEKISRNHERFQTFRAEDVNEHRWLFFDMDGTLARFYERKDCLSRFETEPEFFKNLNPYASMVDAMRQLCADPTLTVGVLTSYPVSNPNSIADKLAWLHKENIAPAYTLFVENGKSKAEKVKEALGFLDSSCVLIDDYSQNLLEWEQHGGLGVKVINDINGRGWNGTNFTGAFVSNEAPAKEIANAIKKIMKEEEKLWVSS